MNYSHDAITRMIIGDFDRSAELYEKYQVPFSNLVSWQLVKLAGIRSDQSILDIGTGTGSAALAASNLTGKGNVIGIDIANNMLSIARRKTIQQKLENVFFKQMDARWLDFPDESFDAVISNLGIPSHYFPRVISEIFRVLRKRGTFCFAEFTCPSNRWSMLSKILFKYRMGRPSGALAARRKVRFQMQQYGKEFPPSSFAKLMRSQGFEKVRTVSNAFPAKPVPPEDVMQYFITREQLEYRAMTDVSRKAFVADALRALEALRRRSRGQPDKRSIKFWLARKPVL